MLSLPPSPSLSLPLTKEQSFSLQLLPPDSTTVAANAAAPLRQAMKIANPHKVSVDLLAE